MDDETLVCTKDFAKLVGVERMCLWRRLRDKPEYPAGRKVGKVVIWKYGEIKHLIPVSK